MMPARLAPSVCQEKRASSGPCCRSLGHTRNTYGLIPDRSGLDADGEIIGVGVAPPPYTRAAEREGPELRCPTTATIAGSAYNCSATRTAVSSLPESSTTRSSSLRPRIPWGPVGGSLVRVETSGRLYRFAGALERLLAAADAQAFERAWETAHVDRLAWDALGGARRADSEALEPALDQVDRRLLAMLERCRAFPDPHVVTFRVPELERWQHAAAAALVGARWGVAGLRTVIADTGAPLGRRYFAFLALAERHPEGAWPLFERYLTTPGAHHAFVAAAVEAARYYPGHAEVLVLLFERIRGDQLLRRFLGPKILESLYVLGEECSLPLFEELLVAGHTDPDVDRCEVTRALVMVRRATGRVAQSCKFADGDDGVVLRTLDAAERRFEATRDRIVPVVVI